MHRLLLFSLFFFGLILSRTEAQVTTTIASDSTLGTVVTPNAGMHDIMGGTRPSDSPNLFHSFSHFSLAEGTIANFLNDSGLPTENILSRVTGGDVSNILGRIQTTGFGTANLFLLNPAGVVFGPSATLNIGGSFHVSTADFIILGTDGIFYADLGNDSVLTTASPKAFGFLGGNPTNVSIDRSTLEVGVGKNISIIGGDIKVTGGTVKASTGKIALASLGSTGEVSFDSATAVAVNATELGVVSLSDGAWINTDGEVGGTVLIRSGSLVMDSAKISSDTTGIPGNIPTDNPTPGEITIKTDGDMLLDSLSVIQADVLDGSHDGANVSLEVGGELTIRGGVLDPNLFIFGWSGIRSFALGGSGNTGDIAINATNTLIEGDFIGILSLSFDSSIGDLGNIRVTSDGIQMIGDGLLGSVITTSTEGGGRSGNVDVSAQGGEIFISLGGISSFTSGIREAGDVLVKAENVKLANTATIQSGTSGPGNAGSVELQLAGDLDIREGAFIGTLVDVSCTSSNCGAAGDTTVTANNIVITGIENAENPLASPFFTGIRTRSVAKLGGNVFVNADNLQITDNGVIRSSSLGTERAGDITINLDENFELANGGTTSCHR